MALPGWRTEELYGGTITVSIPSNFIDTSSLRPIPEHQEVFSSPGTLTSIIFEINEHQPATVVDASDTAAQLSPAGPTNLDIRAAEYHLLDTIAAPDTVGPPGITTQRVTLAQSSVQPFPAYVSEATILIPEIDRSAATTLPASWQSSPAIKHTETKTAQILLRLEKHGTDLLARVNVPMVEYEGEGTQRGDQELKLAQEIVEKIVQTWNVVDFSLFGEE